jgi:hypothetical protein
MRRGIVMVENHLSGQSSGLFLRTDYRNLLLLLVPYLIFDLSTFASVLSVLAAHFLGHHAHLLALPSTAYSTQKTLDFFMVYSSHAKVNRALFPTFTQNLMFIRCFRLLSQDFPLPLLLWNEKTHLFCSSCKRKLQHVQTCLGTWVCLDQHPRDTLWPFRELNCRIMYLRFRI